jgi:hypothetical protein
MEASAFGVDVGLQKPPNMAMSFIWAIGVAAIVWLLLVVAQPEFVQFKELDGSPTGTVNQGMALTIALIAGAVVWALFFFMGRNGIGY